MSLTVDEVRKVAKLSRLELSEDALPAMAEQLNKIIHYVDQLQEINTDDVEPLAHPLPIHNVFREDVVKESLTPEQALANAPKPSGKYFGVPAVFDSSDEMTA